MRNLLAFVVFVLWFESAYALTQYKTTHLIGVGGAFNSLVTEDVSTSSLSPSLSFRKEWDESAFWSWSTQVTPVMSTSFSLVGIYGGFGIGRKIFGQLEREEKISAGDQRILHLKKASSTWAGFVNLEYSLTPIFSSTTTATYSGPAGSVSIYYLRGSFPFEATARYSLQSSGDRSLSTLGLFLGYIKSY